MTLGTSGVAVLSRVARCLLVWLAGTSILLGVAGSLRSEAAGPLRGSLARLPLDQALVEVAALVLVGTLLWGWLALTVTVVEVLRLPADERPVDRTAGARALLPHPVRRLVLAACGVALATGLAQPALAAGGPSRDPTGRGLSVLVGLPLPERAVAPAAAETRASRPQRSSDVVVRPGDCLWSIAARDLPPDATDLQIASRWHEIYAANRAVVGADPDRLEPGQRLHLPRKDPT